MRRTPPKPARRLRTVSALALLIMALIGSQHLASIFLLASMQESLQAASPLTIARYLYYYGDRAEVRRRVWWCSGASLLVVAVVGAAVLWPKPAGLHGDARFATRAQIARAGLFAEHGILLGQVRGRYLTLAGQQGVCLAAPPRSGKGIGVVVPNLLHFGLGASPGSVVCTDIKKENWVLTSGYRRECGQQCHLFDPLSESGATARWNPLGYVGENPAARINDLQRIADMLYPEAPGADPFWIASARALFVGIALYLFETDGFPRTVGEVLRQGMASDAEGFGAHWRRIVEDRARGPAPLSPECVRLLFDVIDLAPVTASSVRKTFTSRLDLWQSPILDAATSQNDFDLRDLRRKPMSLYVGVAPEDLRRLRPVLNLFFEQAIGLQTRELPEHNTELKYQVLMLLDEFAALGRIPIMAEAISFLPGYGVRTVLVIQTPAQLREVYGENGAETMLTSLAARIYFAPKDHAESKSISDNLGARTVKVKSLSRPRFGALAKNAGGGSVSVSEQRRPLMLPQEVRELGTTRELIFLEGLEPILAQKILYFCDRRFSSRLRPALEQPRIPIEASLKAAAHSPHIDAVNAGATSQKERMLEEGDLAALAEDIRVEAPADGEWTEPELQAAVERFLKHFPTR